jgi:CRISPR/Cas system-associated endoribonuclease Cas2
MKQRVRFVCNIKKVKLRRIIARSIVLQGEEDVILIQKENWKWMQRSEAAGMKERL